MKKKNQAGKWLIISFFMGVTLSAVLWKPVTDMTFAVAQGQGSIFDMGDDYEIWWPGYLIYWESKEDYEYKRLISSPDEVTEFAFEGAWLVGKTKKGWFALNKETHEFYYPYSSVEQLEADVPIKISELKLESDFSPYLVVYDGTKDAVLTAKWILVSLPFILSLVPYGLRRLLVAGK